MNVDTIAGLFVVFVIVVGVGVGINNINDEREQEKLFIAKCEHSDGVAVTEQGRHYDGTLRCFSLRWVREIPL